jgi:hypothetical protein
MPTRERSLADLQKPRNDAYTVMLSISLVAMIAACILLYQELKRYPSLRPTQRDLAPPAVNLGGGAGGDGVKFQEPDGGGEKPATAPEATKPANPGTNPGQ